MLTLVSLAAFGATVSFFGAGTFFGLGADAYLSDPLSSSSSLSNRVSSDPLSDMSTKEYCCWVESGRTVVTDETSVS